MRTCYTALVETKRAHFPLSRMPRETIRATRTSFAFTDNNACTYGERRGASQRAVSNARRSRKYAQDDRAKLARLQEAKGQRRQRPLSTFSFFLFLAVTPNRHRGTSLSRSA